MPVKMICEGAMHGCDRPCHHRVPHAGRMENCCEPCGVFLDKPYLQKFNCIPMDLRYYVKKACLKKSA